MQNKLPNDWIIKTLGEVCEIKSGKNQKNVVNPNGEYPIYGSSGIFGYADEYICDENTTIIGRKGTINSPIYVTTKFWNVDTAFGLCAKEDLNSKFLYYFCLGFNFKKLDKSTTIPSLSKGDLLSIQLNIPSLETQQAIVSKIEEIFSELDKGIENLKTTQQQLKTYRQSVLKWAFEGKLTNENEPWKFMEFKDCLSFSQGIQVDVKLQYETCNENQIRFLRIIDFTQGKDAPRYIENPGERYIVNKDEISLVRYGATTGFVCIGLEGVIANNLFKVTPKEEIGNKYLYYFLKSSKFQNLISINIKGAAMPAISFGLINNVILPIPFIEEQHQIVQEIENRLSGADKMEESIAQSLQQAEALRQSILKKAFSGELV